MVKLRFHSYVPDKHDSFSLPVQWLRELFFSIEYSLYFFLGMLFSLPPRLQENGQTVVLIPGLMGRPLAFWRLRRKLFAAGYSVYTVSLGFQVGSLKKKSFLLEQYLQKHNIQDAILVGHSMGGIISLGISLNAVTRVSKVFLVGSPIKGSLLAYLLFLLPAARDLIPSSKLLRSLENKKLSFPSLQSVFSEKDEIILSTSSCLSGGFDDVMLKEFGHFNLIMGKNGIACLLTLLKKDSFHSASRTSSKPVKKKQESSKKNKLTQKNNLKGKIQ